MNGWRTRAGTTVDHGKPLSFVWAGRAYRGFAGDTLASALLANGVSIFGRSFKYHRPRGLIAAGLDEPNGIIQLERGAHTVPNIKATQIELYDGLIAGPVNAKPNVNFDVMAVNSLFKRFIPAGFYYKTFLWPNWRLFEPIIRRAAGLGIAPSAVDPDTYEHRYAHVDVLVIGSGAAGLAAAEAAAALPCNKRVVLVEADAEFGGGLLSSTTLVDGMSPIGWRDAALARLAANATVQLLNRTIAFGFYDHGLVALCERLTDHLALRERTGPRQRLWKVRCGKVILATGAFERPIPFANNDLPGIMLASAAQTYATRFGALPGKEVIVCTNNDSAYAAAFALQDTGCLVRAIIDSRAEGGACLEEAKSRAIEVVLGTVPLRAKGRRRVSALVLGAIAGGKKRSVRCDTVVTSDGWNPAVHLHSQSGGALAYDEALRTFAPDQPVQQAESVGAAAGIFSVEAAIAGARAVTRGEMMLRPMVDPVGPTQRFMTGDRDASITWIDFQNDVTVGDIQLAARENFRSVEHLKRYTTLGMASDQGKLSNIAGIHVLSDVLGKPVQEIGTTRFRPPFDPVTIGAFAGRAVGADLLPLAHTPAHDAQLALGAKIEHYGAWRRAAYFPKPGESERQAIEREVLSVREGVGLFDASSLGKIEVRGPDAAEFLQRIYINDIRTLKIGNCRYGLMLNEHGIVYDDGVCARIGADHYLVGTTSGHADAIADMLEEWLQCEWPDLRVLIENITNGWAVMNLAGRHARSVLADVGTDINLSQGAFPHMSIRSGMVAGVHARVHRVSFTGELSYEIAVPWGFGAALWQALMHCGARYGITPFGVESLMVMRIEKGYLHIGSDTDGTTYPQDVGFAAATSKKPDDFVGRRSTMRIEGMRENRRQLIGLEVTDGGGPLANGAHVLAGDATVPRGTQGWVTSSVHSPTLRRPLALALVEGGRQRIGEVVRIWDLDTWRAAKIADHRFFDPEGRQIHG